MLSSFPMLQKIQIQVGDLTKTVQELRDSTPLYTATTVSDSIKISETTIPTDVPMTQEDQTFNTGCQKVDEAKGKTIWSGKWLINKYFILTPSTFSSTRFELNVSQRRCSHSLSSFIYRRKEEGDCITLKPIQVSIFSR